MIEGTVFLEDDDQVLDGSLCIYCSAARFGMERRASNRDGQGKRRKSLGTRAKSLKPSFPWRPPRKVKFPKPSGLVAARDGLGPRGVSRHHDCERSFASP
jgi:hypothetical protein